MSFNWLDIFLLVILAVTLIIGLIKGLVRQLVGIIAVIAGLILAAFYYPYAAAVLSRLPISEGWSSLIGFLVIFIVVLLLGWLVSFLLSKLMKGPLKFLNHLFGGALGLVKGVLICGVIVFAMLVFPVDRMALQESSVAPYCYWITRGLVQLIPKELKEKFKEAYDDIVGSSEKHGKEV